MSEHIRRHFKETVSCVRVTLKEGTSQNNRFPTSEMCSIIFSFLLSISYSQAWEEAEEIQTVPRRCSCIDVGVETKLLRCTETGRYQSGGKGLKSCQKSWRVWEDFEDRIKKVINIYICILFPLLHVRTLPSKDSMQYIAANDRWVISLMLMHKKKKRNVHASTTTKLKPDYVFAGNKIITLWWNVFFEWMMCYIY